MNKQELIQKTRELEGYNSAFTRDYEIGYTECMDKVLLLIEQLDEPQKVKVPAFVADWIEEVKQRGCGLADALDCFASPIMPDNIKEWLEFNSSAIGCHHDHQELLARAWLDGYEVEEEPKWVVRVGEKLLFKNFDDNEFPIFVIDDNPDSIQLAENFDLEKKAHNVQKEIGGTVEKV